MLPRSLPDMAVVLLQVTPENRKFSLFPQVLEILDKGGFLKKDFVVPENPQGLRKLKKCCCCCSLSIAEILVCVLFCDSDGECDTDSSDDEAPRLPIQSPVLTCRLVCQSWNKAIQDYVQLNPENFRMNEECHKAPVGILQDSKRFHKFSYKYQIQKFHEEFEETHSPEQNPFLGRRVDVYETAPSGIKFQHAFRDEVTSLLEKYGRHIYHLNICLDKTLPFKETYPLTLLEQWLRQTPSVQTLKLTLQHNQTAMCNAPQAKVGLAEEIQFSPIPRLDHLIFLKMSNLPSAICNEFLQINDHIKKLEMRFNTKLPARYDACFRDIMLTNLNELWIDVRSMDDLLHLVSAFAPKSWPVKMLHVNCTGWLELNKLFQMVEQIFDQTLVSANILLPKPEHEEQKDAMLRECPRLRLNLPRLKQLRVQIPCLSSMDFVQPLSESLEELSIILAHNDPTSVSELQEKIMFSGMLDKMDTSNVWEVLPNLSLLEIIVDDSYEKTLQPLVASTKYLYKKLRGGNVKKYYSKRSARNKLYMSCDY